MFFPLIALALRTWAIVKVSGKLLRCCSLGPAPLGMYKVHQLNSLFFQTWTYFSCIIIFHPFFAVSFKDPSKEVSSTPFPPPPIRRRHCIRRKRLLAKTPKRSVSPKENTSSIRRWRNVPTALTAPKPSMSGIFTYIWLIFMVNVGKYTIHGWYGAWCFRQVGGKDHWNDIYLDLPLFVKCLSFGRLLGWNAQILHTKGRSRYIFMQDLSHTFYNTLVAFRFKKQPSLKQRGELG